jgi:hypothetical protein|tara:strand:- start:120 stop:389 length:270 start_codon:yes stop_codon:yes gene_type:complete
MKKPNIVKDLKQLGLIPKNKAYEAMKITGWFLFLVLIITMAVTGAYNYPITEHDTFMQEDFRNMQSPPVSTPSEQWVPIPFLRSMFGVA